ncbi:unnamed protein product [Rhodiola kirilowii]
MVVGSLFFLGRKIEIKKAQSELRRKEIDRKSSGTKT